MLENNPLTASSRVPGTWRSMLVLFGFILIGMSVGNIIAILILIQYLSVNGEPASLNIITNLVQSPDSVTNGWYGLMILQGMAHIFTYLLPPLLYWYYIERKTARSFEMQPTVPPVVWGTVLLLVLAFMPFNSLIIEWNSGMSLPDFLTGVEEWMRNKEDQLARLTKYLTTFQSFSQFVVAMVVIAVIPAIGEEVLFRGVRQRKLAEEWADIHVGIWVAAAIFSAIHVQFYGFFPRMLLGALFGYLYYWTGSLKVAIFGHFVNNGFMVLMIYLYNRKLIDINIEDSSSVPVGAALVSLVVSVALLVSIRREREKRLTQQ